jgi:hypothetical protein
MTARSPSAPPPSVMRLRLRSPPPDDASTDNPACLAAATQAGRRWRRCRSNTPSLPVVWQEKGVDAEGSPRLDRKSAAAAQQPATGGDRDRLGPEDRPDLMQLEAQGPPDPDATRTAAHFVNRDSMRRSTYLERVKPRCNRRRSPDNRPASASGGDGGLWRCENPMRVVKIRDLHAGTPILAPHTQRRQRFRGRGDLWAVRDTGPEEIVSLEAVAIEPYLDLE